MIKLLNFLVIVTMTASCGNVAQQESNCLYIIPDNLSGWFYIVEKKDAAKPFINEKYQFDSSRILFSERKHPVNWVNERFLYYNGKKIPSYEGGKQDVLYRGATNGTITLSGSNINYTALFVGDRKDYLKSLEKNLHIKWLENNLDQKRLTE